MSRQRCDQRPRAVSVIRAQRGKRRRIAERSVQWKTEVEGHAQPPYILDAACGPENRENVLRLTRAAVRAGHVKAFVHRNVAARKRATESLRHTCAAAQ